MTQEACIALLIDADNSPADKIDEILDELAKHGEINIRRAYGNWKNPALRSWEAVLHQYAIQPVQQFAYTKGKNATDMAMSIDAMDLLYTHKLSGFCLASSDSDFTPLVMRIRANGLKVFGFGEQKTPLPFVNACSKFLYLETLGTPQAAAPIDAPLAAETPLPPRPEPCPPPLPQPKPVASTAPPARKTPKELKGDTRLVTLLRKSVDAAAEEDGWAHLGAVGSHIAKQASFDSRNYGYAKLSDLLQAIDLFEIERRGKVVHVRDRRQAGRKPGQ
jgi:uncharacterized LabA/DUF88 family protein